MKKFLPLVILIVISSQACLKDSVYQSSGFIDVTLKNLSGLDGCGFVFQKTEDDKYLEPVNLDNFLQVKTDGKKYKIKYRQSESVVSTCMAGDMIVILEIQEQP